MDYKEIVADLSAYGQSVFTTHDYSKEVNKIIAGFKYLITRTEEVRKRWVGDPESKRPDCGLIEKKRAQGDTDSKFYFHYRRGLEQQLRARVDVSKYTEFLHPVYLQHYICSNIAQQILSEIDQQNPEMKIMERYNSIPESDRHVLRLLSYKPGKDDLAAKHDDKAFLTLHVADSRPGLILGNSPEPIVTGPTKMHAFFGIKAELVSRYRFVSIPHYRKSDEDQEPSWAMVFFTHIPVDEGEDFVQALSIKRKEQYKMAMSQ